MNKIVIGFFVFLFFFGDRIEARVVDIHLPTAEEHKMMEEAERQKENQSAHDTLHQTDSSYEEKVEALNTLVENGAMV